MSGIRLESICKSFGGFQALKNVDLEVKQGEFVTLLGASGSGKTTCLRAIAGFVQADAGRVFIDEDDVTAMPPFKRNIGMVFQHYALFPHMTIAQNVAYGLTVRRLPKHQIQERVREALDLVHLSGISERYPSQLSGGQKQRVALARAVVIRPRVLLLDEPLSALDFKLREELQNEIRRVQQTLGITTINVTHDQNEALGMSDRIAVMRDGQIMQIDAPHRLYRNPASLYVARFLGRTNCFRGRVVAAHAKPASFSIALGTTKSEQIRAADTLAQSLKAGDDCIVAIRPEDMQLIRDRSTQVKARVEKAIYLGNSWLVTLKHGMENRIQIDLPASAAPPEVNEEVGLRFSAESCLLYRCDNNETGTPPPSP
ncbi:MAG: ABC transporter ATP-binding protein [Parvibaculaceae bacterium]